MKRTLISAQELAGKLGEDGWVIVDCRFDLGDTESGRAAYLEAHIPGAIYAHLDQDLCGPPLTDHGRHPLPSPEMMAQWFGEMGIDAQTQVIAYDDKNGAFASRLWWMLQYMGHQRAAVLDGGWQAWLAAGYPVQSGLVENDAVQFVGAARRELLVTLEDLAAVPLLVDSRMPERYRGEIEPIDPVAGHIPGAVNFFYQQNWDDANRYLPAAKLKEQFLELLGDTPPEEATFYCGSGVTSCANLLAMAHAGLGDGRLYVGSWSEWCADPARPVAKAG